MKNEDRNATGSANEESRWCSQLLGEEKRWERIKQQLIQDDRKHAFTLIIK